MASQKNGFKFTHPDTRLCTAQVACDGAYMYGREGTTCGRCEEAIRRKASRKARSGLRGENYMTYAESRRKA